LNSAPRHSFITRATHWITTLCFLALLFSGIEILISHPRFYWGEAGNILTPPLFTIPIPASRGIVKTGYNFVLPDQNGWSRALHFQAAWFVVLAGAVYFLASLVNGHFRRNLIPGTSELAWRDLRPHRPDPAGTSYNPLQKLTYAVVIFVLFPLVIWTGLAMSPGFVSAFPATVTTLGGQQSARTIHFFVTIALSAFFIVHLIMVWLAGFRTRVREMIWGRR
jgi:thiosulfate reductase cytochrome b subunit